MQGRSKGTINCRACSHKCPILHRAISDHRLKSICLLLLLHQRKSHQKRALFEQPHPAYWWGQQQEVDVTIDRLRVISVQPQARIHLSVNVRSTCLSLPFCSLASMSKSEFMKARFIFALCFCLLHWGCGACVTQSMLEGSWRGIFFLKYTECLFKLKGSHKPLDPFCILVCTL